MNIGMHYIEKLKQQNYSTELQQCIEDACKHCLDSLFNADAEKKTHPLMLLGKIQSGKTRAYTGIMALAFDNNVDLVIILTKTSKALVNQTTRRIKSEFKTEILQNEVEVFNVMKAITDGLTEYELKKKIVLIAKKESKNLDKISRFISKYTLQVRKNCLVIDDEADVTGIGFSKVNENEFTLRTVANKVNELRGTLDGCAFMQVTATPYALYLQPDLSDNDIVKPIKPLKTVLVPSGEGYIGGDYYFVNSQEDNHPARFLYEPVSEEENELVSDEKRKNRKSKIDDHRCFKIEEIISNTAKLKVFKKALVNFIVGGSVLRLRHPNDHFSFIIHTAQQKKSHNSLETVAEEFFKQIMTTVTKDKELVLTMLLEAYEDIKKSVVAYGFKMPEYDAIEKRFFEILNSELISVQVINSDREVEALLNEDTGELRLRTPLSIFVGGQVLDRGVTIPNLIGFYYGRNPLSMQQDTVMQHSRMFGYRNNGLLSVTRFYTTRRIYENMTKITLFDTSLRENIENKTFSDGIYFIQKYTGKRETADGEISDNIVPCSPTKISLSNVLLLKPLSRILPIGFHPISKTYASKKCAEIDRLIMIKGWNNESKSDYITADIGDIEEIVRLCYSIIQEDEESTRFVPEDRFISILKYLASDTGQANIFIRKNRTLSKYKENNITYQNAPDTGSDSKTIKNAAAHLPVVMLIHQDGTGEGWKNSPFWWPVLIVPNNVSTTIFSSDTPKGSIVKYQNNQNCTSDTTSNSLSI
jgi:hypothetical protein